MRIGNREFDIRNEYYIMGILNVTSDSFSDGGQYENVEQALRQAERMIADGCDVIDIGGESTKPGHVKISSQEEIERVCPVIAAIKKEYDISVSVDTYKAEVAEAGILAGADLINDIWGLKWNEERAEKAGLSYGGSMATVIAKYQVAACLMHNRDDVKYHNLLTDMMSDFQESIHIATQAKMDMTKVLLDPGIGFAKSLKENLSVLQGLEMFAELGYPLLLGTSRKSVIGLTLDLPPQEREEGTMATTVLGAMKGVHFFRVHDVKKNRRALDMTKAILQAGC
ncbi:MAG: dihydropteroate synthase [Peptococcaceae bacterium]|nr:dihydropteroate synthase [Peptococcaceae bacterium]